MTAQNESREPSVNPRAQYQNQSLVKLNRRKVSGAVGLLLLLPVAGWAGGVVTNCTEAALRAAIAGGGLVTFACDGTITLASTITNDVNLTLDGSGRQVTISGGGAVRLFWVMTNVQFTAVNLTFADGFASAGGAVRNSAGKVSLIGVTLRANVASSAALFESGTSLSSGGAICNESGQLDLVRCSFVGNQAWGGPASNPQSTGNSAVGGAIHNSGALAADFCSFTGNSAIAGAGYSVYGTGGGAAIGGAVWNSGALAISRSTFANNSVTGGNGGQGYNGAVVMEQGLPGGSGGAGGSGDGGALFNIGTASLVNCTFAGNRGQGGAGGAGGAGGGGPVHFGGNGGNGGPGGSGIGGVDGTCNLTNCTLAWNVGVAGSGGAGGPGGTGVNGPGVTRVRWGKRKRVGCHSVRADVQHADLRELPGRRRYLHRLQTRPVGGQWRSYADHGVAAGQPGH